MLLQVVSMPHVAFSLLFYPTEKVRLALEQFLGICLGNVGGIHRLSCEDIDAFLKWIVGLLSSK